MSAFSQSSATSSSSTSSTALVSTFEVAVDASACFD
jgi:hypothetical protein